MTYINTQGQVSQFTQYLWGDPSTALVYEDVFAAVSAGAAVKLGNPTFNNTTYASTLWNGRKIIRFGASSETDGNGLKLVIPSGYNTAWVRILGADRYNAFKCYLLDNDQRQLGHFGGGYRYRNNYTPGSGNRYRTHQYHEWVPINVGISTGCQLALISKPNTGSDFWISGVAFTQNPLNISSKAGVLCYWNCDNPSGTTQYSSGNSGVSWNATNPWHNDELAQIANGTNATINIPVIPNGNDKAFYIVHSNAEWDEIFPEYLVVNGQTINPTYFMDRPTPLSQHYNNKSYERVVATKIPASYFLNNQYLATIQLPMGNTGVSNYLYFREMGTYDWI